MSDAGGSRLGSLGLLMGVALLIGIAAPFVQFQVDRMLFSVDPHAMVDLRFRLEETAAWWSGQPVYAEYANAVYPPHAYLLLRALVVDPSLGVARWAWATQLALLVGMACVLFARWSQQEEPNRRLFAALVPLLVGATWQGAGNGQLHYLPMAAGAAAVWMVAARGRASWGWDAGASALMVLALVKPTSSLPLLILFGVLAGRARPLLLAGGMLGLTTLMAAGLQPDSVLTLTGDFLERAVSGTEHGALHGGTANLTTWLGERGGPAAGAGVTLALLAGFGVWASARTSADRLALVAVACVVARLAIYHRPYDDVLMLPALLVLLRAAPKHRAARVLLTVSVVMMALPGPPATSEALIDNVRRTLGWVYVADGAVVVWLVERARRGRARRSRAIAAARWTGAPFAQPEDMHRRHVLLVLLASVLLALPAPASACADSDEFWSEVSPSLSSQSTLQVAADSTLLWVLNDPFDEGEDEKPFGDTVFTDPNGDVVVWEELPTELPGIAIRPVGGWVAGLYTRGGSTVIQARDALDEVAPEFAVSGWRGASSVLSIGGCGVSASGSSVVLELDEPSEASHFRWTVSEEGVEVSSGFAAAGGGTELRVPAEQDRGLDVELVAIDLAGNETAVVVEGVQGCAGCQGSVLASPEAAWGWLTFLGLLVVRRGRATPPNQTRPPARRRTRG